MGTTKNNLRFALLAAVMMAIGMLVGSKMSDSSSVELNFNFPFTSRSTDKMGRILQVIQDRYVDSIDIEKLEEESINGIMSKLDPHSQYVPPDEYRALSESLEGNFDGIGIEFYMLKDTLLVVNVVSDGPAYNAGLVAGDKIITVNNKSIVGLKNSELIKQLRGPSGTVVNLGVKKVSAHGESLTDVKIVRGKVPFNSIETSYMLNAETGYIKIIRFAATTHKEFLKSMNKLKQHGLKSLVLDLRGNGGGYLRAAIAIADEFLPNGQLIVYTQGRKQGKEQYFATGSGEFEKGNLIVLIDENSASASEIVAGALQDTERATIIGRRSFGKGLVQDQVAFSDGSALRLTVARYYTPLGRCIQKPYAEGINVYKNEVGERLKHGELYSADSNKIAFLNAPKFVTRSGKTVYGGGGIMPDEFIPIDTSSSSALYSYISYKGLIVDYTYDYIERNNLTQNSYSSLTDFVNSFEMSDNELKLLLKMVKDQKINVNEPDVKKSKALIKNQVKAIIARRFWNDEGFYRVLNTRDQIVLKSVSNPVATVAGNIKLK
ncbi:S41 family peptidase [Solitalea lacus]|uniref:S41 family peptidase n=1 Tax=Solitalea lacus TaxID=2911172 RepID=UPI001EDA9203|nr:S41 family peptidase [Solitalea lacus]UKJ07259.1 S41 family peptidase [Solitalea lacus]